MAHWRGHELAQREGDLPVIAEIIDDACPSVVVEAGAGSRGLAIFLADRARAAADAAAFSANLGEVSDFDLLRVQRFSDALPSGEVARALATLRAVVYLSNANVAVAYAWAAAMRIPGSVLLAFRLDGDPWRFDGVSCDHDRRAEDRLLLTAVFRKVGVPDARSPGLAPLRRRPPRPLRSVFLGSARYPSAYRFGVAQGMTMLGAWHREADVRAPAAVLDSLVGEEMQPDLVFTHMLLWPPPGAAPVYDLLELCEKWRGRGAIVLLHDGDPRAGERWPYDVSRAVDAALVNYAPRPTAWGVPVVHWPYAAFVQERPGDPVDALRCDLLFTGRLRRDDALYADRTVAVEALRRRLGARMRICPEPEGANTRMLTADYAASAAAVIGFGRPEVPGWIDTRVFQYPGAGGVLIHDDAGGVLDPGAHYVPCERYNVESVLAALAQAQRDGPEIRRAAFAHVQANHTYVQRCRDVIDFFYGGAE